jgi:hypothetical protein
MKIRKWKHRPESIALMRARKQGANHPLFGVPVSAETKAKISAAQRLNWASPAFRKTMLRSRGLL